MTEKRFTYSKKPHYYGNVIDNGRMLGYADVVDVLNEQHETITSQKEEIQILEEEIEKERNAYWRCNKSRTELFRYKQRVQESLQKEYNDCKSIIDFDGMGALQGVAEELGVELK